MRAPDITFVSNIATQSPVEPSSQPPPSARPKLLTRMSMPPASPTARATSAAPSSVRTSPVTATAVAAAGSDLGSDVLGLSRVKPVDEYPHALACQHARDARTGAAITARDEGTSAREPEIHPAVSCPVPRVRVFPCHNAAWPLHPTTKGTGWPAPPVRW